MMTLEEAITHAEKRASSDCSECAKEHAQLAEWLKELKNRRSNGTETISKKLAETILCSHCNEVMNDEPCEPSECEWLNEIRNSIGIDAVSVVRCKDCKNSYYDDDFGKRWCCYYLSPSEKNDNDFCSCGKRKEKVDAE